jgi:hypothetical protein
VFGPYETIEQARAALPSPSINDETSPYLVDLDQTYYDTEGGAWSIMPIEPDAKVCHPTKDFYETRKED